MTKNHNHRAEFSLFDLLEDEPKQGSEQSSEQDSEQGSEQSSEQGYEQGSEEHSPAHPSNEPELQTKQLSSEANAELAEGNPVEDVENNTTTATTSTTTDSSEKDELNNSLSTTLSANLSATLASAEFIDSTEPLASNELETSSELVADADTESSLLPESDYSAVRELTAHLNSGSFAHCQAETLQELEQRVKELSKVTSLHEDLRDSIQSPEDLELIYSEESIAKASPVMKQWFSTKLTNRDKVIFFRMGDFYEFFYDDAILVAKELNLSLSTRQKHMDKPVPMAGMPYHAYEAYAAKLVAKGYAIAICEQVSDPKQKGLTERAVVRIFTPGTLSEDSYLPDRDSKPLCAIFSNYLSWTVALVDVSSGYAEVSLLENYQEFLNRIQQYDPAEILYCDPSLLNEQLINKYFLTKLSNEEFSYKLAAENIRAIWGREGFARFKDNRALIQPMGALIKYIQSTQLVNPSHLQFPKFAHENSLVHLDAATLFNLELFQSNSGNKSNSFVEKLDYCCTSMGARLFRRWVRSPIRNPLVLNQRLDQVESFLGNNQGREQLRNYLKAVGDIERIVARISLQNATPRDIGELRNNLLIIPYLNNIISSQGLATELLDELVPIRELLFAALNDKQPNLLAQGNVIRSEFNPELARLRGIRDNIMAVLEQIENEQKARFNADSISVKQNNQGEIFIQIPTATLQKIGSLPPEYYHKQTLKNLVRFTTEQTRTLEVEFLSSDSQISQLEAQIFAQILSALKSELKHLQHLANRLAHLDVYLSFAQLAFENGYVRPSFNAENRLVIKQGRHPIIEQLLKGPFIANDSQASPEQSLAIITGPNMGGKSTFMRQNALISLMALVGSFVPADYADIPLFDRILTRIGASDDISTGKSTFMVEMAEMASILKSATKDSLLLIDEIGRGTSTFDGLSLAWACAQYIAQQLNAITFFSTHYFELTSLAGQLGNVFNLHLSAIEHNDEISFLHEVQPGYATKSYGLAVAKLAGIPEEILAIANQQLQALVASPVVPSPSSTAQQGDQQVNQQGTKQTIQQATQHTAHNQLQVVDLASLPPVAKLSPEEEQVLGQLKQLNLNELTPFKALELLFNLQSKLKDK